MNDRPPRQSTNAGSVPRTVLAAALLAAVATACAPPRLALRSVGYDVDVRLDPNTNTLSGKTTLELAATEPGVAPKKKGAIEISLHPDLALRSVRTEGASLTSRTRWEGKGDDDEVVPTIHRLIVERPDDTIRLTIGYGGRLRQDTDEGEEEGQVHNFGMAAHIGEDGIYLAEDGYWYPVFEASEDDPNLGLADYKLTADPVEGFELVAGLERQDVPVDSRLRWRSPYPLGGIVLLGGPLKRWSRLHEGIELHAVLDPGKEAVAQDILDASATYLDRYQALIGPYPFTEFTVLEAFFSSGFAFPTCTQIAGSQLSARQQYRRHGYLDHELLHNWWGNGVYVDPREGNWCEGLASYMGNYYGYVLEDDETGARKQRRNHSNFLSSIKPEDDKPLSSFGRKDGAGRGIGYMKGAAVFQMLESKIGAERLYAGLALLAERHMGRFADWDDLQDALEEAAGEDLDTFFGQWVHGAGAPQLALAGADWQPGSKQLVVRLSQGDTEFELDVPLRLYYGNRTEDVVVTIARTEDEVTLPCEARGLTAVELDPDYQVFRKLDPNEAMPTSSLTRRGSALVVVVPEGELLAPYQKVVDSFTRAILGDEDDPKKGHEVRVVSAGEVRSEALAGAGVLVVGDAVRNATVREFLARTRSPVNWSDGAFRVEGEEYAKSGQAVFFTVHHPDRPEDGVTVYYGNDVEALANAGVLTYYPNSLLVFHTPPAEDEASAQMFRTEVIRRIDFEFHDRVEF